MLNNKTIAVVVPAYNEETQIAVVIKTMPDFVDRIIVVDDCSTDNTREIVKELITTAKGVKGQRIPKAAEQIQEDFFNRAEVVALEIRKENAQKLQKHWIYNDNDTDRVVLLGNQINSKVGGAIRVGYEWCLEHQIDCTAVMAGDAQMDPAELESICMPVVNEGVDYVKGNRLSHKAAKRLIPPKRYFGNSVLSALTKVASGYWSVSDTQTGYTAISLHALDSIDLWDIYPSYGMPNDMLIKLNIANCTIREIPIKPVYAVGEKSKMKIGKVIPTVSCLLLKGYFMRIVNKYFINDFHPMFLLHITAWLTLVASLYFFVLIVVSLCGHQAVTLGTYMGFIALLVTNVISLSFAMWMDVEENRRLQK